MGSVAFYIGSLKKGGAERVFVNLATYFLEQGCNVTMVTQYKKENEYELPAGIRRVISDLTPEEEGGRIANLFRRYRKLRRIFREIHADVVLSTPVQTVSKAARKDRSTLSRLYIKNA